MKTSVCLGEGKQPKIWIMVVFQTGKVTILKEIPFSK